MQGQLTSALADHPEILCIERDSDGAVMVNGFRQDELRVPGLTVWQSKAAAVYAASTQELEARGILRDGFVLWVQ